MSEADHVTRLRHEAVSHERSSSDAAMSMALGVVALLVGLIATMSGIWMGYWHGAPLAIVDGAFAAPEADQLSLYLVVFGTVTTILGGFGIYRSQDM